MACQAGFGTTREESTAMERPSCPCSLLALGVVSGVSAAEPKAGESPADHLPPHIRRVTWFGERADWSHDGKRILFLSKTFGDAMEIDLDTKIIRNRTAHYAHHGYTRALYLSNGDILLSGPQQFDPRKPGEAARAVLAVRPRPERHEAGRAAGHQVLRRPRGLPQASAHRLDARRGAVSGRDAGGQFPHAGGGPRVPGRPAPLVNQRLIVDSRDLPFRCTLETQNYRPPAERDLTFSAYGHQGTDVCGIDLVTKKVTNYSDSPGQYDEPEGIFPDGQYTLVECDKQNLKGAGHIDLWKLKLDGSGAYERLTYFSDYPGYKASNPVVSDDGRFIAFQMAKSREAAGVGHGIFVFDIDKASVRHH